MKPLTPQQILDATAKRQAAVAARKATGGLTVRQQRAAAKAAKAGQSYAPPPPRPAPAPRPAAAPRPFVGRRRRHQRPFTSRPAAAPAVPQPTPAAPMFAPKPTLRPLRLAALAAVEALFRQKLTDVGPKNVTDEQRADFAQYKKLMALALGSIANQAMQNEADTALRIAVLKLVKHAF